MGTPSTTAEKEKVHPVPTDFDNYIVFNIQVHSLGVTS